LGTGVASPADILNIKIVGREPPAVMRLDPQRGQRRRLSSRLSGNAKPTSRGEGPARATPRPSNAELDRHQERLDADDVHHAREVVSEHVQRHLGRHLRQHTGPDGKSMINETWQAMAEGLDMFN